MRRIARNKGDYADSRKSLIDARYNRVETSYLEVEVVEKAVSGIYDSNLTGKKR